MLFDDLPEEFFYQAGASPDTQPIHLQMPMLDKPLADGLVGSFDGVAAFPNSNVFGQFAGTDPYQLITENIVDGPSPVSEHDYSCNGDVVQAFDDFGHRPSDAHISAMGPNNMQQTCHKRKASYSPDYIEQQPHKRPAVAQLKLQNPNGEYFDVSAQPSPYSSYGPTPAANMNFPVNQYRMSSPRPGHYHSLSNGAQVQLPVGSPHTPAFSPSFSTVKTEHSPKPPMTPAPRPASTPNTVSGSDPTFIRTSTLPNHHPSGVMAQAGPVMQTQNFNPFTLPHKATLSLNGDLDQVAKEWSEEELEARRKLIVFERSSNGGMIDAKFKVIPQKDYQRGDIAVNCIWWKERSEAYVTSVDTIALLEALVAIRFTVEEKNRIRRNLEGFRPETVSKAKADSEDFFKVIMGFSNPKPRNIEKDVKVFPWRILSSALKKIIGKYSASYSSAAGPINASAPVSFTFDQTDYLEQPPQMLRSNVEAYHNDMAVHGRMSAPVTNNMSPLALQVPTMGHGYPVMAPGYSYEQPHVATHMLPVAPQTAPLHRVPTAWQFYPQHHTEPAYPVNSMSAPNSAYPRGHFESAELVTPVTYPVHY